MTRLRIASGGVQHETNTFMGVSTTLDDFVRDSSSGPQIAGGDTLIQRYRDTATIHGGYIEGAQAASVELLPLMCARAQPSGIVEQEAFDTLLGRFLERLDKVLPVDGVLLDMHGAMVSDTHEDADGAFIAEVRDRVGNETPIFVTLDLHANITARMAELADLLIGFDTYPHIDMHQRGREAVDLLARTIRCEIRPVQAYRQLPMVTLPPMQCTLREPMHGLMNRVFQMERQPGILTATVSMGFPFADINDAGVSCLVATHDDVNLAAGKANELAGWLWELRDELRPELTSIDDVIRFALDHEGPIIFADGSDNPGGGAPCDGTVALRALIEANFQGAVVGILHDPETVEQAHAAGVAATIDVRIGGKTDDRHGSPVEAQAYVRSLGDGRFTHNGPMMRGLAGDLGRIATLIIGGVQVVVSTFRRQLLDAEMLRIAGINPHTNRLIVVKSAVHFRSDLGPMATHIFDADTPGVHRPDFNAFTYRKLRRPIHPLDPHIQMTDCELEAGQQEIRRKV